MTVNKVSIFCGFLVFLYYNEYIIKSFTMKTINLTDAQHHMLQVLVMFGHENEIPDQEGWNIQTYNNLFDEVMK